jgi:PST family polysaccharide transporter
MHQFLKKSVWSFSSVLIKMISGIVINKFFAIRFGAPGITLLAHFQNLVSMATQIPNDGINRGIIRYWSDQKIDPEEKQRLLVSGLILNLVIFLLSVLSVLVFRNFVFRYFDITLISLPVSWILIISLFIFILNLFLLSVILSFQKIRPYAILNILGATITGLAVIAGTGTHNLNLALISFLAGSAINFLFTFLYVIRHRLIRPVLARISPGNLWKLGEFILMALSVLVFSKLVEFYIRGVSIDKFGMLQTGLWQAVVKISDGYTMVFVNTVGVIYYPQVSSLILDTELLRNYLRDVLRIVAVITLAGLVLVYLFRYPILSLLYSNNFHSAADLMPLQLTGDFFCIISYLLTYIISAQARTRTFIALQAISAVFYISLIYVLIPRMNILAFPAAHLIRYVFYFIILVVLNRRTIF